MREVCYEEKQRKMCIKFFHYDNATEVYSDEEGKAKAINGAWLVNANHANKIQKLRERQKKEEEETKQDYISKPKQVAPHAIMKGDLRVVEAAQVDEPFDTE